jgi:HPt (histidine-containing phosphotransfer) domain-containing protein
LPQLRARLDASAHDADPAALGRAAHALRGALATFHAHPGAEILSRLEAAANRGDVEGAVALAALAEREIAAVVAALEREPTAASA